MAITRKFQFEELDSQSRQYLLAVRDRAGIGMPGIFVPLRNYLPAIAFFVGFATLIVTAVVSVNLMVEEPLGLAMLETAGLLFGGWLIVYAIRVRAAMNGTNYPGHFVYADAETLWECSGSTVTATDLRSLIDASQQKIMSNEGAYTHTTLTVTMSNGKRRFNVVNRTDAINLLAFFNALAWLRSNGTVNEYYSDFGNPRGRYAELPPAIMGAAARRIVERDEVPQDFSAAALGVEVMELPEPSREGRVASGWLNYLLIIAVAVGCVVAFKNLNAGFHDDAIWNNIELIEDQDQRGPWLRAYLADARNIRHREDASRMLCSIYDDTVKRIRGGFIQRQRFGEPKPQANPAMANGKVDAELLDGLAIVLNELARQPLAIATVSMHEKGAKEDAADPVAKEPERTFIDRYSLALRNGVGKELIQFALAPPGEPGMIDIEYKVKQTNAGWQYDFAFSFRKSTNGDTVKTVVRRMQNLAAPAPDLFATMGDELGARTAGFKKLELEYLEN